MCVCIKYYYYIKNRQKAVILYYASLVGYFKALWLGMTHILHITILNCENIEKHTKKMLNINYEVLTGIADALLVNINENKQNNVTKLIEGLPDGDEKKLATAMLKAIELEYEAGTRFIYPILQQVRGFVGLALSSFY